MLRVSKTEEDMASENGTDDRADRTGRTKGKKNWPRDRNPNQFGVCRREQTSVGPHPSLSALPFAFAPAVVFSSQT